MAAVANSGEIDCSFNVGSHNTTTTDNRINNSMDHSVRVNAADPSVTTYITNNHNGPSPMKPLEDMADWLSHLNFEVDADPSTPHTPPSVRATNPLPRPT